MKSWIAAASLLLALPLANCQPQPRQTAPVLELEEGEGPDMLEEGELDQRSEVVGDMTVTTDVADDDRERAHHGTADGEKAGSGITEGLNHSNTVGTSEVDAGASDGGS